MPKWYRDNPGLVDEKTKQNRDEHADLERREFIREAAIAMMVAEFERLTPTTPEQAAQTVEVAWTVARALWIGKPEDC
jgi:hypothetical protein